MNAITRVVGPLLLFVVTVWITPAVAERAAVAVSHDFSPVMKQIAARFREETGHQLNVISGATPMLYQQIVNGAPYDVFLAGDQKHPELLEAAGLVAADSRYTYAVGRLALWSADRNGITVLGSKLLQEAEFASLAIVNPEYGAYGMATQQALDNLEVLDALANKLDKKANLKRVYQAVADNQAELGIVAVSQVVRSKGLERGSRWNVPAHLHEPIRQDVVLLQQGQNNAAALLFMSYLRAADSQSLIRSMGYGLAD